MAFRWTLESERELLRLRNDEHLDWDAIARVLGCSTPDAPRIRYSRLKTGRPRSGRETSPPAPETPAAALEYEVQAKFIPQDYEFDGENYYFVVNKQVIRVPRDTWDRVVALYSASGGDMVQAEIAMEVGMHKKVLEAMLRQYGHYKARPPVTREALAAATSDAEMEPLYERAIEVREHRFQRALDLRKLRTLEHENRELRARVHHQDGFRTELREAFAAVAGEGAAREVPKLPVKPGAPFTLLVNVFDPHFGMRVWGHEGFLADYDTDIAGTYVRALAREAAQYAAAQAGTCARTRLVIGGDVFHAIERRTRRGTPLERDKPDKLVFRIALEAFIDAIETLRQTADTVEVDGVPGNHDGIHEWYLREALALYFRNAPDVTVNLHEGKRTFFLEGASLHVFDHGEEFTRFDPLRMTKAEVIARMTGGAYRQAEKVYFYVGHTHHHEEKTWGPHLKLLRANTFAHTNDHEEELVFYGEPEVNFYKLDAQGRITDTHTSFLTDVGAAMALVNRVGQ
jgi:hypothetical protein